MDIIFCHKRDRNFISKIIKMYNLNDNEKDKCEICNKDQEANSKSAPASWAINQIPLLYYGNMYKNYG